MRTSWPASLRSLYVSRIFALAQPSSLLRRIFNPWDDCEQNSAAKAAEAKDKRILGQNKKGNDGNWIGIWIDGGLRGRRARQKREGREFIASSLGDAVAGCHPCQDGREQQGRNVDTAEPMGMPTTSLSMPAVLLVATVNA